MALVVADRVQQTGTANTTVSFSLSGSVTGFQAFTVIGNNNTTYYAATDTSGNWEVGIGTYTLSTTTLARTTILASSNSSSAVTFPGAVNVFVTYPAGKSVDQNGTVLYTYALYTANATVTAGAGVLANTTSGAFTITLPASPATGNQVLIVDSAGTFGTNNLTVGRNGSTISGIADDLALDISSITVTLVYNGSTWTVYSQIGANTGGAVTLTGAQSLSNKTLTNPTVTDYVESVVALGIVATSVALSLTNGTVQTATLTASSLCVFTMPTATAGKSFVLLLKQAATTGNGTASFTNVKFGSAGAPTITATAGKMDILSFVSDGTNWYGSITQGYTP